MRKPLRPSAVWTWQHQAEAVEEQGENAETGNETAAAGLQEESRQCRGTESGTVHGTWHRATEPHGEVRRRRTWDHRKPAGKTRDGIVAPGHGTTREDRRRRMWGHRTPAGNPEGNSEYRAPITAPRHGSWHRRYEGQWGTPPVADRRPPKHQWESRGGEFGVSGNSVSVSWT